MRIESELRIFVDNRQSVASIETPPRYDLTGDTHFFTLSLICFGMRYKVRF